VTDGRRAQVNNAEQRHLLSAFIAAAQSGDVAQLERLFAADVVSKAEERIYSAKGAFISRSTVEIGL
jgi:hypothetical protein